MGRRSQQLIKLHRDVETFGEFLFYCKLFLSIYTNIKRRKVRGRGSLARKPYDRLLNYYASLGQILKRDGSEVEEILDHLCDPARVALPYEGAPMGTLLQGENSRRLERSQRFSERATSNAKLLSELTFGWELISGLERAVCQQVTNRLTNRIESAGG
jgi:hypothetical protein